MNRIHRIVGVFTVIVFLGTGVYLRMRFPDLYAENESIRFLFRANHVYILFSGLLNVVAGLSLPFSEILWRKKVQQTGSWLLLASTPAFLIAFIVEPMQASPMRPITVAGAILALIGVALHFVASQKAKN
jgi:hypothetical protein